MCIDKTPEIEFGQVGWILKAWSQGKREHPKHTLVVYAALTFFTIVVMAPYKWDKKWMRIKTSVGMLVFGLSLAIYLFCWIVYR